MPIQLKNQFIVKNFPTKVTTGQDVFNDGATKLGKEFTEKGKYIQVSLINIDKKSIK